MSPRATVLTWSAALALLALVAPAAHAQRGDVAVTRLATLEGTGLAPARRPAQPPGASARHDLAAGAPSRPAILLTGYWPPTNEMLRRFSPDPSKNPNGWIGADWEGRGYDVYAFFPEFDPPDCLDCGPGTGDLEVDYQDTSADFWPLAEGLAPVALMTFSRGAEDKSWEVEMNQFNRDFWVADYDAPTQPTPAPPDASVPADTNRPSTLPVQAIVDAVNALNNPSEAFICFSGDGGAFLSEFIAYHGVWYQALHDLPADPAQAVAAGHVHVGSDLSIVRARQAAYETVRVLIEHVDGLINPDVCQQDLGLGGPGDASLSLCGKALASGQSADLLLTGAPPSVPAALVLGATFGPAPFKGGQLVPVPWDVLVVTATDPAGELVLLDLPGGGGPLTAWLQVIHLDSGAPQGVGLSNALELQLLP